MIRESVLWPPGVVRGFLALVDVGTNAIHCPNLRRWSKRGRNRPLSATGHRMMPDPKEGR
jgi:hypothetical protein